MNLPKTSLSRLIQLAGYSLILFLLASAPIRAQDVSSIKSGLAAKICPAAEYSHITYDDRGCGWSAQKACDEANRAPSAAWQACYSKMNECRKQIDADNQVVDEANRVYRACEQRKSDADQGNQKANSMSRGRDSGSGSSDLASRLAAQKAKNANSEDVRWQQDQQFDNTVRTSQERYQQFKAQEEAERESRAQAARERAVQQSARTRQRLQTGECVPRDVGYGNYCMNKCGGGEPTCMYNCAHSDIPPCD